MKVSLFSLSAPKGHRYGTWFLAIGEEARGEFIAALAGKKIHPNGGVSLLKEHAVQLVAEAEIPADAATGPQTLRCEQNNVCGGAFNTIAIVGSVNERALGPRHYLLRIRRGRGAGPGAGPLGHQVG